MRNMKDKFKNYLGECLAIAGIIPADLARAADTSAQNIGRFVNGERELTPIWAERLAPFLKGLDAVDVIFGPNRPISPRELKRVSEAESRREPGASPHSEEKVDGGMIQAMIHEIVDLSIEYVAPHGQVPKDIRDSLIQRALREQSGLLTLAGPPRSASRSKAGASPQAPGAAHNPSRDSDPSA